MAKFSNKIALITGAAKGIGKACAKALVNEGATVIVTDILDDAGESLCKQLGHNCIYIHLDVRKEEDWKNVSKIIKEKYKRLDILVNNAGITGIDENFGPQDPEHASLEDWQYVHAVNSDSVFLGCKYAIGLMKEHGGSIINMSSRSGMVGVPAAVAYASSKASIRNHTKSVALYCASKKYNIRCNSIHPAAIYTDIWAEVLGNTEEERKATLDKINAGIPLGKMGEPVDVANAVIYLASDDSKYITGTELTIDGGILAGSAASL